MRQYINTAHAALDHNTRWDQAHVRHVKRAGKKIIDLLIGFVLGHILFIEVFLFFESSLSALVRTRQEDVTGRQTRNAQPVVIVCLDLLSRQVGVMASVIRSVVHARHVRRDLKTELLLVL